MSDKSYHSEPGVYIYDTFEYPQNENVFMTAIYAEINPLQYWRDRPLLISRPKPLTADAVNLTPKGLAEMTGDEDVINTVDESIEIYPVMVEQKRAADEVKEDISAYPPLPPDTALPRSLGHNISLVGISDLADVADVADALGIEIVPEEVFLDRVGTTQDQQDWVDGYVDLNNELLSTYGVVVDQTESIVGALPDEAFPANQPLIQEFVEESWKPMGEPSDQWYGIPLINLGPKDAPTSESYMVEINACNDWNVCITNVVSTGLRKDVLVINKQVPPGKKFMVGVYLVQNKLGLILRIQGDPKIYQKEIRSPLDIIPKALSYGVDNQFIKSLSGHLWDVLFWKEPSNFNYNVPSPEPTYPDNGWIYDFRKTGVNSSSVGGTIDGNTLRSIYDYGPTTRAGSGANNTDGRFLQLIPDLDNLAVGFPGIHPWYFMYESYLDNFFCRRHLQKDSFTIVWYQWLFQYPTGKHIFVSDPVYSNYLTYDYDRFEIIFEFNGRRYQETITLPEELWGQFSLRYNKEVGDLTFTFYDARYQVQEKITLNIGTDLEFELVSLFGRFDKEEKEYKEVHRGLFGMVMIHEELRTDEQLIELNAEVFNYIDQYSPSSDQLITI